MTSDANVAGPGVSHRLPGIGAAGDYSRRCRSNEIAAACGFRKVSRRLGVLAEIPADILAVQLVVAIAEDSAKVFVVRENNNLTEYKVIITK